MKHQSAHRLFVLIADSLTKKAAQAASHSFGTKFMMKRITANFYNSLQVCFSLILIVLMLCPASFSGAVRTTWSKTDSFQKTRKSSTFRRAENPSPVSVFSNLVAATTTSVTSSVDPSLFGQPVTFTATVSTAGMGTPTGLVQFFDNGNAIGSPVTLNASGQAQLTTSALSVGNHTITAQYAGDGLAGFNPSSGSLNTNPQTVNKASTTTAISSNQSNPVGAGIPVTYTATVSPVAPGAGTRTGTITFNRNGLPVCSNVAINASGQATCSFAFGGAGNYNITAIYSGDTNFNASTSPTFVQQVVGPSVGDTTTFIASSANPSVIGQSVTFTATVTGAGGPGTLGGGEPVSCGTVQFYDGATPLGGLVLVNGAGQAQLTNSTLTVGNHTITAQYLGGQFSNCVGWNPSTGTLFNGQTVTLAPSAATVSICGRVTSITGRGIMNVRLTLTDSSGQIRTATTNASGDYQFDDVQAGDTYILTATGKRYTFSQPSQVLNVNEETTEVNFIANTEKRRIIF